MDMQALLAPDTGSPLGQSRARVLDLLRAASSPLGVQEVADRAGLHSNTARFHLDGLVEAGLANREPQPRAAPGRPSMAYRATGDGDPAGARRYRLLAEMLASLVTGMMPDPGKAAEEAGREWGGYLTEQPPPYQRPSNGGGRWAAHRDHGEAGVHPASRGQRQGVPACLRHCPFREVAQQHQDVVCALHLGLMRGALAQMRAPVTADRLEPFVEPNLCVAHLTTCEEAGADAPPPDLA